MYVCRVEKVCPVVWRPGVLAQYRMLRCTGVMIGVAAGPVTHSLRLLSIMLISYILPREGSDMLMLMLRSIGTRLATLPPVQTDVMSFSRHSLSEYVVYSTKREYVS